MSDFDRHGSHIPMLVKAIEITDNKPALELGMGWGSTPILHWLCADRNRPLISVETDPKWLQQFYDFRKGLHDLYLVENWQVQAFEQKKWSVVLIDNRPAWERHIQAIKLAQSADIVLVHDSEPEIDRFYAYRKVWKHYKYRFDYTKFIPNTTVLSNFIDVEKEFHENTR